MPSHDGGCLCEAVRYRVSADPVRVTICHCRYCQRATGSAYMIEPIFEAAAFEVMAGTPATHTQVSEGSGKQVSARFCGQCGTRLWLRFERFPDVVGVYGGTFDDPAWFDGAGAPRRHIFTGSARHDSLMPPGIDLFEAHVTDDGGRPQTPRVVSSVTAARDLGA